MATLTVAKPPCGTPPGWSVVTASGARTSNAPAYTSFALPSVTVTSVAARDAVGATVTFTRSPVALAAVTLFTFTPGSAKETVVLSLQLVPLPTMDRSTVRPWYA